MKETKNVSLVKEQELKKATFQKDALVVEVQVS
jgi:hypothetical protein